MKASINQSDFAKALGQVSRIVSARTTLPVLGNILVTLKKGELSLLATDLELGVVASVPTKAIEEGEITVPARLLSDFVLNNSDETIEVESKDQKFLLKSPRFKAEINGIAAEEFPTIPKMPKEATFKMARDIFTDALKKVVVAAAVDETRPTLSGVYFVSSKKGLALAATDSYRLAEKKITLPEITAEQKMIVPTRTVTELLRIISSAEDVSEIKIVVAENQVFFGVGGSYLVSRLIEGSFPNYSQIVPTAFKITLKMAHREVLAAIKMASLFSKDSANNVRFSVKEGKIAVNSAASQVGEASAKIAGEASGGDIEIAFNARYLIDALNSVSAQEVILKLNDGLSAGVIAFDSDPDLLYIVMPLKVE